MTREERLKQVFQAALERPGEDRALFVDRACQGDGALRAEVESLLRDHEAAGDFLGAASGGDRSATIHEGPGDVIDRYKLLQEIGEGGFGVVYMAEQTAPVRRKVALKIIKLGMDTKQVVARFEAERQALALMDHPNIARILDGGATDTGRPYFVMELVKGIPITEYCDQVSLDTAGRLRLFEKVCQAVQHAHQKGIIHRDLKPGNVLVTLHDGEPVPKVIDFGIAKATDRHLTEKTLFTEFRQVIGTPEYMSPEQAEMSGLDVDTRADIYSLGVMLYELLTGTKPFDLQSLMRQGYDEILRTIREVDPPKPSTRLSTLGDLLPEVARKRHTPPKILGRVLRGDLDWIVMRALEKDRTRRYDSATALAQDIERHLSDHTVLAGPPGVAYRVGKYVRRHRVGVTAASLVALALVGGLVAALLGLREARTQEERAVTERDVAERARDAETTARRDEEEARAAEATAREDAEAKAEEARRERDEKEKARAGLEMAFRRSEGIRLLAQSQAALRTDPALALLLAIEGAEREPGAFANRALVDAMEASPAREVSVGGDDVVCARLCPRGERIATSHADGTIRIWSAETGERLREMSAQNHRGHRLFWIADGRLLHSVSTFTTVVFDAGTGAFVRAFWCEQTGPDRVMELMPKTDAAGRFVLTHDADGLARLYSAETGHELHAFPNRFVTGTRFTVARSGNHVLALDQSGTPSFACLWDLEKGEVTYRWPALRDSFGDVSPDDRRVVIWSAPEGECRVLDRQTGDEVCRLEGIRRPERGYFSQARFSWDGRHIFTWDRQEPHRVHDAETGRLIHEFDTRSNGSHCFEVSPDGERLAIVDQDDANQATIRVYELHRGREVASFPAPTNGPFLSGFDPRGERLLVAQGSAVLRDLSTVTDRLTGPGYANSVLLFPHPDGRHVLGAAIAGTFGTNRLWNLQTRRPERSFTGRPCVYLDGRPIYSMIWADFSEDGRILASGDLGGNVSLWDATTGAQRFKRRAHGTPGQVSPVWSVDLSPDGRRLLTAGKESLAKVWDAETGELLLTVGEEKPMHISTFCAWAGYRTDGRQFMTLVPCIASSRAGPRAPGKSGWTTRVSSAAAKIWDAETGDQLHVLEQDPTFTYVHAAYSRDGRYIRTTGGRADQPSTALWDPESGKLLRTFEGGIEHPQTESGFSPDSRTLVAAVPAEGVRIYELESGRCLRKLPYAADPVQHAWFSPDGHLVLGNTRNHHVVIWNAETAEVVLHLRPGGTHAGPHACFSPDSRSIVYVGAEYRFTVLPLDVLSAAKRLRPRELSDRERERYELPETGTPDEPVEDVPEPPPVRTSPPRAAVSSAAMERAIREGIAGLSDGDPRKADALQKLAKLLRSRGELAEAEEHQRAALRILASILGDADPQVSEARHELGHILEDGRRFVEAIEVYEKSLRHAPPIGPGVAANVALCLEYCRAGEAASREDWTTAARHLRNHVELSVKRDGEKSPRACGARLALASVLRQTGQLVEAEDVLRTSYGWQRVVALQNAMLADTARDLGLTLYVRGNRVGGRKYIEEALALYRRTRGPDPCAVADALVQIPMVVGMNLIGGGRPADAVAVNRRVLEEVRGLRADSPEARAHLEKAVASALAALADALLKHRQPAEAEPLLRECLLLRGRHLPGDMLLYNAVSLLGASLAGQENYEKAEPLLVQGYEGMAPGAFWKPTALERLIAFYEAWGKPGKAEQWRSRGK